MLAARVGGELVGSINGSFANLDQLTALVRILFLFFAGRLSESPSWLD
jgi:hypothetical protein